MRERLKKLIGGNALLRRLRRFPKLKKSLVRLGALVLASLVLGLGWSAWNTKEYLPTLEGNVFSMLAGADSLYMVLSSERNNCLVRVDDAGRLLNYSATASSKAYQDLDVSEDTVYAILNSYTVWDGFCGNEQSLVSLSLKDSSMRPRTLLDLKAPAGVPEGVVWREVYAPGEGEKTVRLAGIGGDGQGYLLRWDPDSGRAQAEQVLKEETLFVLKYVSEDRLVWIGRDGCAGQEVNGVRQRDVLKGFADTPNHVSTCGERCFLSDSVSGDIFELREDGSVERFRSGGEEIGKTGYRYGQMETFTTYREDGTVYVVGLCAAGKGLGSTVAGESRSVSELSAGGLRALMLWEHGWQTACVAFFALAALAKLLRLMFRSPRLATRLAVGEILTALLLIGLLTAVELDFFGSTLQEDAEQKLQMVGRNLISALSAQTDLDAAQTAETVEEVRSELEKILGEGSACSVNVFWQTPQGPAVGYDPEAPAGCLAEDVKNRNYSLLVRDALKGTADGGLKKIQNANNADFVHAAVFPWGERTGCVVVSQPGEALLYERFAFLGQLAVMALVICPALFLGLILMTRRLLRPLGEVRAALEEFYASGGGNRIELEHMPRTELYEVGRVFNELSVQTRVQFNKLSTINDAYVRLVPECLLKLLGKEDVQALSAGDYTAVDGAILMFLPERPARSAEKLERFLEPCARHVQAFGGMLVDYDEGLGAVTALFQDPAGARECARAYLTERGEEGGVTAAVFDERVEAGVFGAEKLMHPLAVSQNLHRKQEALGRLSSFGAALVRVGEENRGPALRLLGWDGDVAYREDPSFRPSAWQSRWPAAAPLWERGVEEFARGDFICAMRTFAQVLRALPGDGAARWYLFRCAELRDGAETDPDLGLLYDWRDERG